MAPKAKRKFWMYSPPKLKRARVLWMIRMNYDNNKNKNMNYIRLLLVCTLSVYIYICQFYYNTNLFSLYLPHQVPQNIYATTWRTQQNYPIWARLIDCILLIIMASLCIKGRVGLLGMMCVKWQMYYRHYCEICRTLFGCSLHRTVYWSLQLNITATPMFLFVSLFFIVTHHYTSLLYTV